MGLGFGVESTPGLGLRVEGSRTKEGSGFLQLVSHPARDLYILHNSMLTRDSDFAGCRV